MAVARDDLGRAAQKQGIEGQETISAILELGVLCPVEINKVKGGFLHLNDTEKLLIFRSQRKRNRSRARLGEKLHPVIQFHV